MASVAEDNKPQSAISIAVHGGKNLLLVYKKLKKEEEQLTNPRISFQEKIPTLITVWLSLKEAIGHLTTQSRSVDKIIEWAQRHTLNLVLHGDWAAQSESLKNHLYNVVSEFDEVLTKSGNISNSRCKGLIEVIKDPWGDATLCKILNDPDSCSKDEELNFFSSENGYIVAMRLKKLCDSRCEDLALRFANACLRCLRLPESRDFHVITTEDQKRYILDIYIALLHKYKRTQEILNELKNLSLEDGLQMVYRFTRKRVELARIWKHCSSIAELAANYFITAAMTQPVEECGAILSDLFRAWIVLNDKSGGITSLPKTIRRIIQAADSSAHIYICIDLLNKQYGDTIKSFTIELYIRALTTDMNELEKQKQMSNDNKVAETSKRLAEGFLSLADIWHDNLCVSRECVLTSFSLNPTSNCMERIEKCAEVSEKSEEDIELKHKNIPQAVDGTALFDRIDEFTDTSNNDVPPLDTGQKRCSLFSNSELSRVLVPQALGLPEQLCDDLVVVLSSPRYQYLSWVLEWTELKAACNSYLENAQGSRNVVKELKYLNIDYNQFKDWPVDDKNQYGGIEKGYEQYTEDEDNTESDCNAHGRTFNNDSDGSVIVTRRRRRKSRKLYSSDSDFDINQKIESHSSDIDTTSHDADSLGSDGLQIAFKKRHLMTNEKISRFNMMPFMQSYMLPEKRSSDPSILKTLRMFRSIKKRDREDDKNQMSKNMKRCEPSKDGRTEGCLKMPDGQLITFPLTANLNPRVLLDRKDCNNFENRMLHKKVPGKQESGGLENKLHKYSPMIGPVNMNPCVILDRYEDIYGIYKKNKQMLNKKKIFNDKEKKNINFDVLADVPGLHSLEMIRPSVVHPTVQVVQISTNMNNTPQIRPAKPPSNSSSDTITSTTSNVVASTPVTAHIQRVGQLVSHEKTTHDGEVDNVSSNACEQSSQNSNDITRTSSIHSDNSVISNESGSQGETKQTYAQSAPTLVNILSQQIIRPGQSGTPTSRNSALINILSQQIIKPPITQLPQKIFSVATSSVESSFVNVSEICVSANDPQSNTTTTTSTSTATATSAITNLPQLQVQPNSIKLVTSTNSPVALQHIFSTQGKTNTQVLKNVNLVTNSTNPVDATRLVQFICKTDGKVVHLTPYATNANIKLQALDASKLVKTVTVNSCMSKQPASQVAAAARSTVSAGYEENFAKFIQTTGRPVAVKNNQAEFSANSEEAASSLPKFQQAFGKAGYQQTTNSTIESSLGNVEQICTTSSNATSTAVSTVVGSQVSAVSKTNTTPITSKPVITSKSTISPLGVQTIQGSVIYTRQVPVSLSVSTGSEHLNIIPVTTIAQGIPRNQVFKISSATGEAINATKDNVIIRNKMSALLAAALQSNVPSRSSAAVSTITSTTTSTVTCGNGSTAIASNIYTQSSNRKVSAETEVCDIDSSSSNDSTMTSTVTSAMTNTTPTLVTPMRITLPMMQRTPGPNGMQTTRIMRPILQIPQSMIRGSSAIRQQVLLAAATPVAMTGVVTCSPQTHSVAVDENLMPHNNIEPSVSSTTLEQLREFDLVLEQVKERSTVHPNTIPSNIEVVKPSLSVNTDIQEVISNANVSYINPNQASQKLSSCTSVVVVTSYCSVQPAASPALSVTSQSSSSPCVTPAPTSSGSSGKTVAKQTAKSPKSKTVKTTQHASKTSPIPKPQQKPQEDEQTTQRIFDILAEYAEQLRNSPDLNNKPAPRRRSNPPTNPSQNSKRKKCSSSKKSISVGQCNSLVSELSPGAEDQRTMGSEDSCGIVQLSVQNSPQDATFTEDHQSTQCSSDFGSVRTQQNETSDSTTVENHLTQSGRQFIFSDSNTNQSRNVIIADSGVSEALVGKLSNTAAVIVPANYIMPMVKGGQPIAVVSGSSKILATVPTRSGSNMLLFQSFQTKKTVGNQQTIKSIKYSTVQPLQGISSQIISGVNTQTPVVLSPSTETVTLTHPLPFKKITEKATVITTDKTTLEPNTIIGNPGIPLSTSTSQKCNVILAAGNVSDISSVTVAEEEDSTQAEDSIDDCDDRSKSPKKVLAEQCIKIMPICGESVSVENEGLDNNQSNNILHNTSFSINFSSKDGTAGPVFNQIVGRPVINEKDKTPFLQKALSHSDSVISDTKTRNFTSSEKGIATTNTSVKFLPIDCTTTVGHYSKMFIEEKKKPNTNGPMLGQSDSDVASNIINRRESDKVLMKRKLTRTMSEGSTYVYHKQKKTQGLCRNEKEIQQRKQEALERELCLQKSLSEECEDLGVDEPSTSDLFPEAELLFDSNNSPSFDQLSQDIDKKYVAHSYQIEISCNSEEDYNKKSHEELPKKNSEYRCETQGHRDMSKSTKSEAAINQQCTDSSTDQEIRIRSEERNDGSLNEDERNNAKETTVTLFSDDDNSDSTLRTDLLFESLEYPSGEGEIEYNQREKSQPLANGSKDGLRVQRSASNYSGSSFEEHSLMTTCASSSDLHSPIQYDAPSSPLMHKYKYKYCNRKRLLSAQNITSNFTAKTEQDWENNQVTNVIEVIKMLSSEDEDTTESLTTENTAKSSESRSPSPVLSEKKRSASPSWEENNDESSRSFQNMYNPNKLLKMAANNLSDSCPEQDPNDIHRKSSSPCTLECLDSSTPPSPLSPEDGELGSYGIGRGARRSTQRLKKKCPCCTSPEKPRKANMKKNPRGLIKKR